MPAVLFRAAALRPALVVAAATTVLMSATVTPAAHVTARVPHPAVGLIVCPVNYFRPLQTTPLQTTLRPPVTPPHACPGPKR